MKFTPHEYQRIAIQHILDHPECAVFLDMGLGKTVITLTAVRELMRNRFEVGKVLVVAPARVARDVWSAEVEKWDHLKGLTVVPITGPALSRLKALRREGDVYTISRDSLDWLVRYWASRGEWPYDMIVIDELSSFKNHKAVRYRALSKVRAQVSRIVGLTGTPAVNGLGDLWAEFRLLDQGERLGKTLTKFRLNYMEPDFRRGAQIYSYRMRADKADELYAAIGDITLSMQAADHLAMPELISTQVKVSLSAPERKAYDAMKRDYVLSLDDGEVTAMSAAGLSNKLLQMANGSVYSDTREIVKLHERKLEALEELIEAANGSPVMVAYWFKHDLTAIERMLDRIGVKHARIDGCQAINEWNAGALPVGLIHPASAGHGLNLQSGGHHFIWYGLTWSLELYQQANARLYRQGQRSDTVVIQHIITAGTMDERVMLALENKDADQSALLRAVKAEIREVKR